LVFLARTHTPPPCLASLYVANSKDNTVSIHTVNATTGQMRANSYMNTGKDPLGVVATPSGQFVYVANSGAKDVSGFQITTTNGTLNPISGSPFTAETTLAAVAAGPRGKISLCGQ